jgi:uncharacterized protein YbjT (DUF2867 family)
MRTILLTGATGLIGLELLARLLRDERFDGRVVAPTRREIGLAHPKLVNPVVDSEGRGDKRLAKAIAGAGIDAIDTYVSCLGTTIRKAGSEAAFRAVDHDLVLRWGRLARELGARQALLVSSVGADPASGVFYLRVKGETERDLAALGFPRVDLIRPGQLLGEREESRPLERVAQFAARLYSPWLKGGLSRYRAITAATVADAMAVLVREQGAAGERVHHHDDLQALADDA